jgi:hypothetical protein
MWTWAANSRKRVRSEEESGPGKINQGEHQDNDRDISNGRFPENIYHPEAFPEKDKAYNP